ncbi:MAG: CapA family protein [Actinobacteria bacterium]|nr:MAG: CapA family protein [Actinomycetota bacterium]
MKFARLVVALSVVATGCTATSTITTPTITSPTVTTSTTTLPQALTFAFTGDVLSHTPLINQAQRTALDTQTGYDFRPMFADVKQLISSVDVAICHLETPIAPDGEKLSTYPFFGVPKEITTALADAGFDRCSTASNHAYDRGNDGIDATVNALLDAGVQQSGMARTPEEIEPHIVVVDGIRICHLSYTFSYNGLIMPDETQWRSAIIDTDQILRDAKRARELGSQATIVSMHWGNEKDSRLNSMQTSIADELTASGLVDLIVGHHAHVVQPTKQVNGVWVMFGLGNVLSNLPTDERWPVNSQDAVIATTSLTISSSGKAVFDKPAMHPTWVDKDHGWVIRDIQKSLQSPTTSFGLARELEMSLGRTSRVLGDYITK